MYRVLFSLEVFAPGSVNPLKIVKVGDLFDLAFIAQDLRTEGEEEVFEGHKRPYLRGIYAAYVDVTYRKDLSARVGVPIFSPYYQWNPQRYPACTDLQNRIGAMGAVYGTKTPPTSESIGIDPENNPDPTEIVRVRMKAQLPIGWITSMATQVFRQDLTKLFYPPHATLLWGNSWAADKDQGVVTPDQIQTPHTQLIIQK